MKSDFKVIKMLLRRLYKSGDVDPTNYFWLDHTDEGESSRREDRDMDGRDPSAHHENDNVGDGDAPVGQTKDVEAYVSMDLERCLFIFFFGFCIFCYLKVGIATVKFFHLKGSMKLLWQLYRSV